MRRTALLTAAVLTPLLALTACAPAEAPDGAPSAAASATEPSASTSTPGGSSAPTEADDAVKGTILRFRSTQQTVDVTIGEDNPTVRDLLSRLPLELTAEEFAGREKIADVPDGLETAGSPGSDPEDGDLIYYTPWGNLGFYYDAAGIGYSDQTIHIGTYDATRQQLDALEGPVTLTALD